MSLNISRLSLSYSGHKVLNSIDLQLQEQQVHGLVGINGAGKTSLLNCIAGVVKQQEGTIEWNNGPCTVNELSYLETSTYTYPGMTGDDYLRFFSARNPAFSINDWNNLFQLPLSEYTANYSSGMLKKLALMGILALDKTLILLDEPFNALDLEAVELLKKIIARLKSQGKTILLTSHILQTLTDTCDQIHYLNSGTIQQSFNRENYHLLEKEIQQHTTGKYDEKLNIAMGK
jgi:ABC-2 type transport system ATP-binding protein